MSFLQQDKNVPTSSFSNVPKYFFTLTNDPCNIEQQLKGFYDFFRLQRVKQNFSKTFVFKVKDFLSILKISIFAEQE